MADEDEIRRVARLMRIDLDDHAAHIGTVRRMIEYLDILDRADTDGKDLAARQVKLGDLREDRHVPFDGDVLDYMKTYRNRHVRAPKMT